MKYSMLNPSKFLLIYYFSFGIYHNLVFPQTDPTDFSKNFCLVETNCKTLKEANTTANIIKKAGSLVGVIGTPKYMIGWIAPEKYSQLVGKGGIVSIIWDGYPSSQIAGLNNDEKIIIEYYNSVISGELQRKTEDETTSGAWTTNRGCIPETRPRVNYDEYKKNLEGKGVPPSFVESICEGNTNSEYMRGTVACVLFFVESDGTVDPDLYTWTTAAQTDLKTQAIDAWSIWSYTASLYGRNVTATVSWYDNANPSIISQPYEPITRPFSDDYLWITAILSNLGFTSGSHFDRVYAFNTWMRSWAGTDWAYSAFLAYNPSPAPTVFTDSLSAYAFLGGPYTHLLYRNNGWPVNTFFRILGHETSHIFHAFDEYAASPPGNCTASFNGILNSNYQGSPCNGIDSCVMIDNSFTGSGGSRRWNMCNQTPSHIGWTNLTPSPSLVSPANGSTLSPGSVNFVWNRNTTNDSINSYLAIASDSSNQVVYCSNLGTATSASVSLPEGTFRWLVLNGNDDIFSGYAEVPSVKQQLYVTTTTLQAWAARYNGPGNSQDEASALAVDASGNVYVTGGSVGSGTSSDYVTIKYNSLGDTVWVRRYNGPGNSSDGAVALAVDDSGNVYVTGTSVGSGTSTDYATVKYNGSGVQQWAARYNGLGNSQDEASALAVDASGNVYVTGSSYSGSTWQTTDYATIKYNSSGVQQWVARYNNSTDDATALTIDDSGNVYVTGYSKSTTYDYATVKYNASGVEQWVTRYNGPGNDYDQANALAVDDSGNVYVTGGSYASLTGTLSDYATVKYNSSGVQQWVARYNGPANNNDNANALAVDDSGNVYVTGWSHGSGTLSDYATVKYNSSGVQQWVARYNGPGNSVDVAQAIAVDGSGSVYVTGRSRSSSSSASEDYATIKYSTSGTQLRIVRYNGSGDSTDGARALAIDVSGNLYVTGYSTSVSTGFDYATLKYVQSTTSVNDLGAAVPLQYLLKQNFPNPFNPSTQIRFFIPSRGFVSLKVYDLLGREVAILVNEEKLPGTYQVPWDPAGFSSGIYFYRLQAGTFTETRKLVVLR